MVFCYLGFVGQKGLNVFYILPGDIHFHIKYGHVKRFIHFWFQTPSLINCIRYFSQMN